MSKRQRVSAFQVGKNLIVIKKDSEHDLKIGETVKLLLYSPKFDEYKVRVTYPSTGETYPQWISGECLADPEELSNMEVEFEIV